MNLSYAKALADNWRQIADMREAIHSTVQGTSQARVYHAAYDSLINEREKLIDASGA